MFSAVNTGGIRGMDAYPVRVEVDLSRGLPCFELVGSAGSEVKEARERVQIALKNEGVALPVSKITVNLSPADIRKEGTGYDLPIAAGLLACMGMFPASAFQNTAFLGELALNGEVRRINGVLPIVIALKKEGIDTFLVPAANAGECAAVPGIRTVGLRSVKELIAYLKADETERSRCFPTYTKGKAEKTETGKKDFVQVCGQESAKRAAEVAAAGFHHLLLAGAPGTGKTMIAERIPGILPPMSEEEKLEVSAIYSIAGKLESEGLMENRPFLAPHHTVSPQAMAGGGRIPRPGLLSLSHRGLLFLDEMPEFSSAVLEVLRQPMEERKVHIDRSHGSYTYPADFMLVCAMNPCPCGYFPDRNRCNCSPADIRRYLGRISGPILDRIDMITEAAPVAVKDLYEAKAGEDTDTIRQRVLQARERQQFRYRGSRYRFNGELPGSEVKKYCFPTFDGQRFLEQMTEAGQISARAFHKILRLARTTADLAGSAEIGQEHLAEAICYNSGRRRFWNQTAM